MSKNKAWICHRCKSKNPADEGICQGCDLEKLKARIPREKYFGLVRDIDQEPWASFDNDGDGVLSPLEFERLYSLLRKPYFGDSLSVFNVFDDDRSGTIDYNEFNNNIKNPLPPKTEYTDIVFIKDSVTVLNCHSDRKVDERYGDQRQKYV